MSEQPQGHSDARRAPFRERPLPIIIGTGVAVVLVIILANLLGIVSIGDIMGESSLPADAIEPTSTPNPEVIETLSPGAIAFTEATWCRTISENFQNGYDEFGRPLPPRNNPFVYLTGDVSQVDLSDGYIILDVSTVTVQGDDDLITLFRNEQCYSRIYLQGDFFSSVLGSPNINDRVTAACIPRRYRSDSSNQYGYKEFTRLDAQDCQRIGADDIPTPTSTPRPLSLGG